MRNKSLHSDYEIENLTSREKRIFGKSVCEKDQGVFISQDLKWGEQVKSAAAKGNKILGMLKNTFVSRDSELWKKLYTTLVRPHLEYAAQLWSPDLDKDIERLEKVQRRASKIPKGLGNLPYEERLKIWGLTSLKKRRERGDVIQMYKHIYNLEDINWHKKPRMAPARDTSDRACRNLNNLSIQRESFPSRNKNDFCHFVNVRHEFFTNRVSEFWNKLPNSVVNASTMNTFKARHDEVQKRLL